MQFRMGAGQTRLDLIVGDSVRPDVVVMLGGIEQSRARYVFTSSDPSVIRVYAGGDSIVAEDRGTATLVVTLVGSTIGNNRVNPSSRTADTIVVAAAALSNTVTPQTVAFQSISARQSLVALSLGRNNKVVKGTTIAWRSTNSGVVSVVPRDDSTAEITAMGNGTADVWAVFGGVDSTFSTITVSQQLKRYLLTTASSPNLRSINETMTLMARPVDSLNNTIGAGAPAPAAPTFVSDNPGKVEVDPASGVLTARGNTNETPVKITATVGGAIRSDTLQVTVTQVAASLAIQSADTIRLLSVGDRVVDLGVLAPDALGTQVPPTSISWTSTDPTRVQVVGSALATITAQATGTVVVRARADQQTDSVIVVVTNDPAAVTLSPKPFELRSLDETRTLTATVTNTAGTVLTGIPVTWISRDSSVVEPQPSAGVMRARGVGEARIVASTSNGLADSVLVRVTNAPDTVIIVDSDLAFASVGDANGAFPVDFKNARGVALPRDAANWSSHDVTVARVVAGTITSSGPGVTYIVAVSPENASRRDSVRVTVTNSASTVTVSPNPAPTFTAVGASTTFTAVVRNAAGNVISGAPVVWSVPAGGASVSVDAVSGVATALANGTATVRATSGTATGDVSVTVAQAISTTQSGISPASNTLVANGSSTTAVTVQLRDANGTNITTGGATVTLGLNPAIATLTGVTDNGNGTYGATLTAGTTAGTVTISGTVNGTAMSNTGVVTLQAGPATQYVVSVTPTLQPVAGSSVTATARLADANGNAVAGAGNAVAWSSTGGGSFSADTTVTNASGAATVTFTTNSSVTPHTITATTAGISGTSPAITPVAGGATAYVVSVSSTSPAAGSAVTVTAQLRDGNGNSVALANQTVTWSKSDPNGSFSAPTSPTNAAGLATVTLTTHTAAGTATSVTATSGGITGTSATITTTAAAPTQIAPLSVTSQSAEVNTAVAAGARPSVLVRDANNNPVAGVLVTFTVTAGGGSTNPGSGGTVTTDAAGIATLTSWTLGQTAGTNNNVVTATVGGLTGSPVTFTASGTPGAPATLVANSATSQSATVGSAVTAPPSVLVRDAFGNAVGAGQDVTFTLMASGGPGGAINPPSVATVATNASGVATLSSWTLGQTAGTGNNSVTATIPTLNTITFTASGTAAGATSIAPQSATTQSATVATAVTAPPSVLVTDVNGNPVAGFPVTFTLTFTGGTGGGIGPVSPATVPTNASGVATLTSWTLGQTAGTDNNTVTATGSGLATIVFNASGTAGTAQNIIPNSITTQGATVGTAAVAPSVVVRDAFNNPVANTSVTFTLSQTGGTGGAIDPVSPASVLTNASGVASLTSWTLGQTAGTNNNVVTATAAGLTGSPVTFTASGTPGTPAALVASSATSQSATVATAVAAAPSVLVRDAFGNAVGAGQNVTFTLAASGGAGGAIDPPSVATVATNASGVATLTSWTLGQTAGTGNNTVTATIPTLNTVTFTASGVAGTATQLVMTTPPSGTATVGIPFAQQPVIELRDAQNNLVTSNSSTVVTAARLGGAGTLQGTLSTTAVNGVASFTNLAHNTASTITIQFTASGLTSATSGNVVVNGPTQYAVSTPGGTAAAGSSILVSAQLRDASNNNVALAGKTVTWSRTGAGGSFATPTSVTDASGVAQVAFTVHTVAGTVHTITATDNTALTGTSGAVTVVAAAPAQLVFVAQPTDAPANATLSPAVEVEVRDAFGNPVLADPDGAATETITLAFTGGTNTEGATLSGTLPQAVNWGTGRASFADLSVNLVGDYGLTATEGAFAAALTDGASSVFNVLATTASIAASASLTEAALNNGSLTIQISNGTFNGAPGTGDFSLTGAPAGVTIAGVTRNNPSEVVLDLDFDNTDFDTDRVVSVNVAASALATGTATSTSNAVTLTPTAASTVVLTGPASVAANTVTGAFTLEAREANGTSMTVPVSAVFNLTENVVAGTQTFFSDALGATPITQATIANGASSVAFYYRDTQPGTATVTATWASGGANLGADTHNITVNATTATIAASASLAETVLNNGTLTVQIANGTFVAAPVAGDFSLSGAPAGVSVASVTPNGNTEVLLDLDFNGTDFDINQVVSVNVLASGLATGIPATTSNSVTFTPAAASSVNLTGPAAVAANTVSGAFTLEAREANGTSMTVAAGETFTLTENVGAGTQVFYSDAGGTTPITQATIAAASSTAQFYYRDTEPGTATVTATWASGGTNLGSDTHAITVNATTATISASSNLAEATLNNGTLTVQIANGTFTGAPVAGDFTLTGAPAGVTIAGVAVNNTTQVVLDLDYSGTDFDVNQTVSVNVLASALATGIAATTANTVAFTPTAATTVVLTGPATVQLGVVSGAITLTAREANGTSMTVIGNENFNLTSTSLTAAFYSDAGGTTAITAVTIPTGQATAQFFYRDSVTLGNSNLTAAWTSGVTNLGSAMHTINVTP